ncbi:hypothetical protein [Iningainema tapete]|uniref:Uncharacterized protein n=1 Tax=Iningainema tapete BLCC-T55 TaxID=2748662 RepID=A0A8J6XKF5_9CYAN|nr:hypothetical protein [Iningainema tapete]MBD2773179.1 hypothetical protein [Iningainema tapete BLCC-T55]
MLKLGRNSTSWEPTWKHGKTKTIRVPITLADQILEYARAIDAKSPPDQENLAIGRCEVFQWHILQILDEFIEVKRKQSPSHRHDPNMPFLRDVPTWRKFNEFYHWVKLRKF